MKISRYLTVSDFCKEADALKIYDWSINAGTLERLERQRSLFPRLRIRYPDEIVRRWLAEDNLKCRVKYPMEPDGQRWEDANAFEQARDRGWPHIFYDPRTVPCALDNPEIRFLPFIETPSEKPFIPWKNYKIYLSNSKACGYISRDTVVNYYSSWQLLQFVEVVNMGVTYFINLFELNDWPSDEEIIAAPRATKMTPGALPDFEKHKNALDAIVWFTEEFAQGRAFARRRDFSRRILTDAEISEVSAIKEWAANAACERYQLGLDTLTDAIHFLCEKWCKWHRMGRPLIANAYKLFAGQGIQLATITSSITADEFSKRLGDFSTEYFNRFNQRRLSIIQVMWPDWASEQRDYAHRLLQGYNRPKALLQANFSEDLITRFLDYIKNKELHGFYWRLQAFHNHAFEGNDYYIEGLKGDVVGMAVIVEHIATALVADCTDQSRPCKDQLYEKFKRIWEVDAEVNGLLKSSDVTRVSQYRGPLKLYWFEEWNVLSLPQQTAADLAITFAIRGGAHRLIKETDPLKLERMMLIMLRAAVKTFDAATKQATTD